MRVGDQATIDNVIFYKNTEHTDAYIVLTYGIMSINEDVINAINTAIDDFDDEKISFVTPAKPS